MNSNKDGLLNVLATAQSVSKGVVVVGPYWDYVSVVQYLRPDGRQKHITILMPSEVAQKWKEVCESCPVRLAAEVLQTGEVSLLIESTEIGQADYAMEIVANGPAVQDTVCEMIMSFDVDEYTKWREDDFGALDFEGEDS
jgi:hypothetical protein